MNEIPTFLKNLDEGVRDKMTERSSVSRSRPRSSYGSIMRQRDSSRKSNESPDPERGPQSNSFADFVAKNPYFSAGDRPRPVVREAIEEEEERKTPPQSVEMTPPRIVQSNVKRITTRASEVSQRPSTAVQRPIHTRTSRF